jgi:hypothetical protein
VFSRQTFVTSWQAIVSFFQAFILTSVLS